MSPLKLLPVLAVALVAGCVSTPQATAPATALESTPLAFEGEPTVVTLEEISIDPGSVVICRDGLKQGSNVIVTTCMSRNDWKRRKVREAAEAASFVRTLQGGAYR